MNIWAKIKIFYSMSNFSPFSFCLVCLSVCPFVRNCLSVRSCPNSISSLVFGLNTKICIPKCFQWCLECHKNIFGYLKPLWEKLQKEESERTDKQTWTNRQTKMSFRTSISHVKQTDYIYIKFCELCLSICLSVHLSVCWNCSNKCPSVCLSICVLAEKCPKIYFSVCAVKNLN